jgi:hypothetical protein
LSGEKKKKREKVEKKRTSEQTRKSRDYYYGGLIGIIFPFLISTSIPSNFNSGEVTLTEQNGDYIRSKNRE